MATLRGQLRALVEKRWFLGCCNQHLLSQAQLAALCAGGVAGGSSQYLPGNAVRLAFLLKLPDILGELRLVGLAGMCEASLMIAIAHLE